MNILLVEDQAIISESLVRVLESRHFQVMAYQSAEALMASDTEVLDCQLAIVDISLPGMDGITLSKRLRAMNPSLGIIILTMHKDLNHKLQSYEAGADLFLTKPVPAVELLAAIQSLVKRLKLTEIHEPLMLRFDPIKQKLTLGENFSEALSFKETKILQALLQAKQQQLEHWELLELNNLDLSNKGRKQLEVIMSRLRQKLVRISGLYDSLLAVRGMGYRLTLEIELQLS
ncbi:response regulator transcription factor [Thiomicrospira microaerophila]|uniref:response regulator transcription factor n=1 Tax=Thiomicrospira microaerophila TaxID=406020 RepID=UPI00200F39B6|nr:response regulator transcription factor [Thiomicrospira microaerophila]UQB42585.1 response regulator transcription factor [Thiomicrospira microaerophila]